MKKLFFLTLVISFFFFAKNATYAHVVVRPAVVGIGEFQTFTTGVPNEKDIPTTGLRLVIPEGVKYVSPNVKPGWEIEIKKSDGGEDATVTEIIWTGGSIPAGQRDDFLFSAKVPDQVKALHWNAYQTYENGEVVAWDEAPPSKEDDHDTKPYSQTTVIDDIHQVPVTEEKSSPAFTFSLVAIALAALSLILQLRKK